MIGAGEDDARDLDQLLPAERKQSEPLGHVDIDAKSRRCSPRLGRILFQSIETERVVELVAKKDVLGDGQAPIVHQSSW